MAERDKQKLIWTYKTNSINSFPFHAIFYTKKKFPAAYKILYE